MKIKFNRVWCSMIKICKPLTPMFLTIEQKSKNRSKHQDRNIKKFKMMMNSLLLLKWSLHNKMPTDLKLRSSWKIRCFRRISFSKHLLIGNSIGSRISNLKLARVYPLIIKLQLKNKLADMLSNMKIKIRSPINFQSKIPFLLWLINIFNIKIIF